MEEPDTTPLAARLTGPALLLMALAAVLSVCWLLYWLEAGRVADQQRQRENTRVGLLTLLIGSEIKPLARDLRLLGDGDGLRHYLESGAASDLQAATRQAQLMSTTQPDYDQVRFINEQGLEILRVDRGGNIVVRKQLQNKADRHYFQMASTLPPGGLYMSSLDLNVENGQVEVPLKPMLRLAVPIFDSKGLRRGIYVINYLGANLIARLQQAIPSSSQRLRLIDANGYWLKGADPAQEWGFALPGRSEFTLARSNPSLWARIQDEPTGQSGGSNGLFTWKRVPPEDISGVPAAQLLSDQHWLVVAAEVSPTEWAGLFEGMRRTLMVVAPGLMALTLLSAWLLRARRKILVQLRSMNQQLERRVGERTEQLLQSSEKLAKSYEELQHREALLAETGNLAKVGGWEFDPATGEGTWTPEIAQIHNLPPTLTPSKEMGLQFYPGESRTRIEAAVRKSIEDGSPYDLELEFIAADGERKWVRTISRPVVKEGRVIRMRGALQDITDRKLSELRLHTQLQRMHLLERTTRAIGERQDLASILQVVIRTLEEQLALDFSCVCLYDATDRILTVTAVGIASRLLAEQLSMPERARIPIDENGLSRCVRGQLVYEEDISEVQFPFPQRLAAGGLRALVAAPLQIESQVFGVLLAARREAHSFSSGECEFLRQLSEHVALAAHQAQLHDALKSAYEDLRNTQQAVMQQERLRVLGQMASGIAHDINNAISPITLYADALLENEPGLSERVRQSLQTIQQATSDVAKTVARMREFYRQSEGKHELQPVQLNALILQLRDLTRARWEAMPQQQGIVIDLQMDLAEGLPPVRGIEHEIREALINLIFNAVDAMPSGGTLVLRTRPGTEAQVDVEVADSGAGMDEQTRRRCLEPFFTTKGERGTGLGLPMVYGVMQRHGGDIDIDSAPGAGTTMRLSFAAAETTATPHATPEINVPTGLTILLVDDDPILLRSLREILELDGHEIFATDSGQGGINAFHGSMLSGGRPISVVITDLGMPHVDGRTVASAVKKASPTTPVILLTGWGERLLTEGQEVRHVDRVLSKPPRLRDLRKALADVVAGGRGEQESG